MNPITIDLEHAGCVLGAVWEQIGDVSVRLGASWESFGCNMGGLASQDGQRVGAKFVLWVITAKMFSIIFYFFGVH